jgi:spore germination cell wall hydrolase CwlJ-like protein
MITAATLCLAMNIYHEARGEHLAGQIATANVVMNRVHSPKYPDDICSVVKQGRYWEGNPIRHKCAFSWFCDGRSDKTTDHNAWTESVHLAYRVENGFILDITDGATHYHATHVMPYWADHYIQLAQIGNHLFYQ